VRRNPTPKDEETFRPAVRRFFPGRRRSDACGSGPALYTNSPDWQFIWTVHPHHENVTVACGFSGHGFKFAPVIGEALADLATAGTTTLPIGFSVWSGLRPLRIQQIRLPGLGKAGRPFVKDLPELRP
jgi:sarcosine oxidase